MQKKIQAFGHTFEEVIKRDKNFGSLLTKIKKAYDEYLHKHLDRLESDHKQSASPSIEASNSELLEKVQEYEREIRRMQEALALKEN